MKRIIRLTESDLVKLVKRVISEQTTDSFPANPNTDVIKIPASATNYKNLFKGPRMTLLEAQNLYNNLIQNKHVGYLKAIYLDDTSVVRQGQERPGTPNVSASTEQKRPVFQVMKEFKINGQPVIKNGFLNTCDQRIEDCGNSKLRNAMVELPDGSKLDISL